MDDRYFVIVFKKKKTFLSRVIKLETFNMNFKHVTETGILSYIQPDQ